jgi:hypothetical protein
VDLHLAIGRFTRNKIIIISWMRNKSFAEAKSQDLIVIGYEFLHPEGQPATVQRTIAP